MLGSFEARRQRRQGAYISLFPIGVILGLYWGLHWDNGKENGNQYLGCRVLFIGILGGEGLTKSRVLNLGREDKSPVARCCHRPANYSRELAPLKRAPAFKGLGLV